MPVARRAAAEFDPRVKESKASLAALATAGSLAAAPSQDRHGPSRDLRAGAGGCRRQRGERLLTRGLQPAACGFTGAEILMVELSHPPANPLCGVALRRRAGKRLAEDAADDEEERSHGVPRSAGEARRECAGIVPGQSWERS